MAIWKHVKKLTLRDYVISPGVTTVGWDALSIKHTSGRGPAHLFPGEHFTKDDWKYFEKIVGKDAKFYKNLAKELAE